jgi:tetratricopeptide (TPR) repeat protein
LLRQKERDLVGSGNQTIKSLQELQEVQEEILQFGELPDYEGTEALVLRLSTSLASQGNLVEFGEICRVAAHLPLSAAGKWQLLEEISQLGLQEDSEKHPAFNQALVAGLVDDWPGTLWVLAGAYAHQGQPAWWSDLGQKIRHFYFQIDVELLPPLLGLSRIFHVLQANLAQIENQSNEENAAQDLLTKKDQYQKLVENLKTEILTKWGQTEPEPPDSGLDYQDLERILDDLGQLIPNARLAMLRTLDQPNAQVRITLEAWNRKEFDTARKGLRRLLAWDPHRWRVFAAERAILRTPEWLEAMRYGPQAGETLGDYMTRMELMGRELRSRVGPAVWMDGMLRILQRLRKGARAQELIAGNSELVSEMPWIGRVGWVHATAHAPVKVISLEREMVEGNNGLTMSGVQETRLGLSQGFVLGESLDTWAPEARGSSARVFLGYLQNPNGHLKQSAVKIMRGDRTDYALPLFLEEITILRLISDVPGVSRLLECGFVKFDRGVQLPPETTNTSGREVRGEVHRFGLDSVDSYLEMIESRVAKGWHPYVVIEKRNTEDNLMLLCDAGYTHGKFLSLAEGLRVAIQICDIFHEAHNRNIVYRDHKILHYYWQELYNGVFMIDWNVAKYHPQGITVEEKQFDLVQFGARALHHIFTGRTAPGALPMGPTRPEEIDAAAHSYRVQWTYDDQRLPFELKELLERVLAGGYTEFLDLRNDLVHAFNQIQGL